MKTLKPSMQNLKNLQRALYEITGSESYLHLFDYGLQGENFFTCFYSLKNELMNKVNAGEVFGYPLFNVCTKQAAPFIYNSL